MQLIGKSDSNDFPFIQLRFNGSPWKTEFHFNVDELMEGIFSMNSVEN